MKNEAISNKIIANQNTDDIKSKQNNQLPYYLLGGEQGIRFLCREFYKAMDESESATEIRAMHGKSLENIEQKLFEYLSGWMGGPHIYLEKYGSVCLSSAHKPYKIDEQARDQWLMCMDIALEKVNASDEVKKMLKQPLFDVANMLRNT